MKHDYWLQKWQKNDIRFNQSEPNRLLTRFWPTLSLPDNAHVLVPLCGKSVDMLWLCAQGHQVTGIELSQIACERFFEEHDITVEVVHQDDFIVYQAEQLSLYCGDFFKLNPDTLPPVHAVYDRAALVALPETMRNQYAAHLIHALPHPVSMLLITTDYDQSLMPGPPFSINPAEIDRLYQAHFEITALYNEPIKNMPPHLKEKGVHSASELCFQLVK